jgi:hypothetical protein
MDQRLNRSRPGTGMGVSIRDEKINLIEESVPNYARIDHFETDPFKN